MLKFTGNYSSTTHNFVFQNIKFQKDTDLLTKQIASVLKNILLRGSPTMMSHHLQENLNLSNYHLRPEFKKHLFLVDLSIPNWYNTILGGENTNPAKDFYYSIPELFSEYPFIQQLILPETLITDIIPDAPEYFYSKRVDFYLDQAKLIIEIDGGQHFNSTYPDSRRDKLFADNHYEVIRIKTSELKNVPLFQAKLNQIKNRLNQFKEIFDNYSGSFERYSDKIIINSKLLPSACLRWQVLLLTLIEQGYIDVSSKSWNFNVLSRDITGFENLATKDLFLWLEKLYQLHNIQLQKPEISIKSHNYKSFNIEPGEVNIDFSLFRRYTDENESNPGTIYVRNDYFDNKNYFRVCTNQIIAYDIKEEKHSEPLIFLLHNIFNKNSFRDGQLPIIISSLRREDTIGLLPTGAGKSLCYQLAALLQPAVSFVISPLKSLMFDQKENLNNDLFSTNNYISSEQTAKEREIVQKEFAEGRYLFIWISPERLQIKSFREYLSTVNTKFKIAYAVIDEVHCLSEWGHDFRTSYLNISKNVRKFCPGSVFLGLTATASSRVHKDIKAEFNIKDENIKTLLSFDRPELTFKVIKCPSSKKLDFLKDIIEEHNKKTDFISTNDENCKSALIFTPHVGYLYGCFPLFNQFDKKFPGKVNFFSGEVPKIKSGNAVTTFMPKDKYEKYKLEVQRDFKINKFPLLFSTKAFGMGIDKPNINLTVHYGISPSIESIYQEAGRAGRHEDKKSKALSECYILFSDEDEEFSTSRVFDKDIGADELKNIVNQYGHDGNDLIRQLFFYNQSYTGIEKEYENIVNVLHSFTHNAAVKIPFSKSVKVTIEKAIYRLSILNVISDYTIDYNANEFEVQFTQVDDILLDLSLKSYIQKYDDKINIDKEIKDTKGSKYSEKCIRFLLKWIYDNIAYERRQALKGIADLCREYQNPTDFKLKLIKYFEIDDVTILLQYISEYPDDFNKWLSVFIKRNKNGDVLSSIINNKTELDKLKIKLQRFLESYRNNTGLNFVSGLLRLILNEYNDQDGKIRFEGSLYQIKENYNRNDISLIIMQTTTLLKEMDVSIRETASKSIISIFNSQTIAKFINDTFNDHPSSEYLINYEYLRLQKINKKLYGELSATK